MANLTTTFYKAKNISEVLYHIKTINNLKIYGGGTSIKDADNATLLDIGQDCLFLGNVQECRQIEKHERYIDFGSEVTLAEILNLGKSNVPDFIFAAISSIANPYIRNVATIAGNICSKDFYHTLYSPLLAVNAKLEIQTVGDSSVVSMNKFNGIEKNEVMTKIRIPIIDWDITNFTRVGPEGKIDDISCGFTFLAKTQKDTLVDIRISYCGQLKLYFQELANMLIGSKLPLSEKTIQNAIIFANESYDSLVAAQNLPNKQNDENALILHPMLKNQFINLLRKNLEKLT